MDTREKFEILYKEWMTGTMLMSDPSEIFRHESLQKIIKMAEEDYDEILQYIFEKMSEQNTISWFNALSEITGENPLANISRDDRGNVKLATNLWLEWAINHGYEDSIKINIGQEKATELEWLIFFYQNAEFGPASGDVRDHIAQMFKSKTGKLLPNGYSEND